MIVNWLEFAQRLAEGARAKVAEDRRRLEEPAEQRAENTKSIRSRHIRPVNRPSFTLIAGANGAGKSTLTSGNPSTFASIPVFDPDTFAKTIRSSGTTISPIAAGREVLRLTEEHLKRRQSFAVETTLSGKNYLRLMRYARDISRGFEVTLIYIGTDSVEINLARIAERPGWWSQRSGGRRPPPLSSQS
jgi:predicted ATPase